MSSSYQESYTLCQEKLAALKRALILETDASVKFKLEKSIEETKKQLSILAEEKDLFKSTLDNLKDETPLEKNIAAFFDFINRHPHLEQLKANLKTYTEFEKPLFCIIYGCRYELLENFIKRLEVQGIGSLIQLRVRCTSEELELQLLNPNKLIFYQSYDDSECRKEGVEKILEEFFEQWHDLRFKNRKQPILFCVLLKHAPHKKAWWQFWEKSWKDEMCSFLNKPSKSVDLKQKYNVNVFILPELTPVKFQDLQDWISLYLKADGYLINQLKDKIYQDKEALAMYYLLKELKDIYDL